MGTETEVLKLESDAEECCVCGARDAQLSSPEEADAAAPQPAQPPLRAMLLHLNNAKVVPNGRLCQNCIHRTVDAYNFSCALATKSPPPLSEKIRALRNRLQELTQKIDVFIVVGGGGGAGGAYSEEDIIMVERAGLEAASRADDADAARAPDARGDRLYQCTACPLTFHRMSEFRDHASSHPAEAAHWCWTCGARLPSAAAVARHALTHAPDPALHCHLCDTTYQSGASLRAHAAACAASAGCPSCGAVCGSLATLRTHAHAHEALCPECFLRCEDADELAAHRLHHRRDKHFVCGYKACILRFHTRSNLLAHIRKCHGGEGPGCASPPASAPATTPAPVLCAHCPRTFGSAAAMKRHARTHLHDEHDTQDMEWTEELEEGAEGVEGAEGGRVEYLEVEALEEADAQ